MKKFSALLAVVALSACASSDYQQKEAADQGQGNVFAPHVFELHTGERAPSSADCDASASWQPAAVPPISVNAGGGTLTQAVKIKLTQNCRQQVWVNGTCYQDVPSPDGQTQTVTYTSYANCGQIGGGSGKSSAWNDYYAAPAAQKSAALAKAIKGVGPKAADALVQAHTFDHGKPRSWDQFSQMINDAANQNILSKSQRTEILGTYASDNMQALGYNDASSCTGTQVSEQVPVMVSQPYTCPQQQTQTFQNVLSTRQQSVTMNVAGSVLQPFEQDQVSATVSFDGSNISVTDAQAGPYNTYTTTVAPVDPQDLNKTVINFNEQGRNRVALPGDLVTAEGFQPVGSGQGDLMLQINLSKYAPSNGNDQVMVDYYVSSCPIVKGWFGKADSGHCAGFIHGNPWVNGPVTSRPLTSINHIAIPAPHDHKVKVFYTIYRRNSRFYDNQPLGQQATGEIRGNP